jgi:signal peptidase I
VPLTRDARLPGMRLPKPGDIVIFKSPQSGENLIKRCVAVAGQSVEVRDKILYVDGARRDEAFTKHIDRYVRASRDNFGPLVVPAGNIFCMGDNRDASHDSRFFGPVPLRLVIAKADVLYFSFNVKKFLPRINRIGKML